ncbi:alpha/beta fold hydrolase [Enterococcus sp. LJL51]|uniref:alpha/beta fold hydrolase n=1 Tax=Enterococcus sp. LJL51 TaxID=3416656 RepID=UPI003CF0E687
MKQLNEKIFIEVNGNKQGMFIQSKNIGNPVLLFLHGGPGSPEIMFTQEYPTGLEDLFTVCWWEQRGSGISYRKNVSRETMTINQMIADTLFVVSYLRERFSKEKIFIMGHSWGTLLGILTVQKSPELFQAYIGIGQMNQQIESERLAYKYMLNEFRTRGDKKMIKKLEKVPINQGAKVEIAYLSVRNAAMMKLGIGLMRQCRSVMSIGGILIRFKGYKLMDKVRFMKGNSFALNCLWDIILQKNLEKEVPRLEVPIYVLHGQFDYQVSYSLSKQFVKNIKAPVVGFYTFENSAHSPCFEEPEKMCRILREDVLYNKTDLADNL